jgi:hypothetical protein
MARARTPIRRRVGDAPAGWDIHQNDDAFLTFLVATHLATALVLLGFFWRDWVRIVRGFFRARQDVIDAVARDRLELGRCRAGAGSTHEVSADSQRFLGSARCDPRRCIRPQGRSQMKKRLVYVLAAACLVVGGALSGQLLSAGAATSGTSSSTPKSNETSAHEKGESAAREKAEDSGQAFGGHEGTDGPDGDGLGGPGDGGVKPNEDPAHEKAESAQREAQEHAQSQGGGSAPAPSTSGSSQQ